MKAEDRKIIKEKIEIELQKLGLEIEDLKEMVKPIAPENAIGRVSRMDAINNKSINEAALRKAEIRLNALKVALKEVDQQDFGMCFRCNEPIPIGRLLLRPQSRSCVKCAH